MSFMNVNRSIIEHHIRKRDEDLARLASGHASVDEIRSMYLDALHGTEDMRAMLDVATGDQSAIAEWKVMLDGDIAKIRRAVEELPE